MNLRLDIVLQRRDFTLQVKQDIRASGLTAIFGPSGCGKTTLLRCIAGLEQPVGAISLNGTEWLNTQQQVHKPATTSNRRHARLLPAERRNVAYVFQDARLLPHLNVQENIALNVELREVSITEDDLTVIVKRCGIFDLMTKKPDALSGGQRQRVCLARALASKPDLILMDEPLSALDSAAKKELLALLKEFKRATKTPIVYVSHSIEEVAQLADDLIILEQGVVRHVGPAMTSFSAHPEWFDSHANLSVFDGKVLEVDHDASIAKVAIHGEQKNVVPHFWLSEEGIEKGQAIRVLIYAQDVSISLNQNSQQSILNVIQTRIEEIEETSGSQRVTLKLGLGEQLLLAQITKASHHALELKEGMQVWAQIKALSVYR